MGKLSTAQALQGPESQENFNFAQQSEIERLFDLALAAELPRSRALKYYEPARLNERHLAMIMMRSGGVRQCDIAEAFNVTDSNASVILNHPDAEYLLARIQAMKATHPSDIEGRLRALAGPAVDALEDLFADEELAPIKKAPYAFRALEANGYFKPRESQVDVKVGLSEASTAQLSQLTRAIQDASRIQDAVVVETLPPSGPCPALPEVTRPQLEP